MKTILYLIQKEFLQIFRDKMMLPIIIVIPVFQLLILSYTATYEIKKIDLGIADLDQSISSRSLISKFEASPFYILKVVENAYPELDEMMQKGELEQFIYIPQNFEEDLLGKTSSKIQLITDAINGSAASLMSAYSTKIIMGFNKEFLIEQSFYPGDYKNITTEVSYWYNPDLNYKTYMVPGILVLLVTVIGLFLASMNIVKEKEIGTIEQLNVTPIKKSQFIIGKLMPFWILAMIDLIIGLLLARFVFMVPMVGSIPLVLFVASLYLILILGMGLFISTLADTQQQSMFISWFFVMIFILLSGLFTPIENMPVWAQKLNLINPIAYFIEFMRMVLLKGSEFKDVWKLIASIAVYGFLMIMLATLRYRKHA
jgi:ABC-2 type transport system permease protein